MHSFGRRQCAVAYRPSSGGDRLLGRLRFLDTARPAPSAGPRHHAFELVVVVCRGVGEVAIVRAYLCHCGAVTEHDLQTVFWFPVALAFDRDVDMLVTTGIPADPGFASQADMLEDTVRP